MLIERQCSRCEVVRPIDQFYDNRGYGPSGPCKPCRATAMRESYQKNREVRLARSKAYAKTHPEQRRAAGRRAYWKHKDTPKGERQRAYKKAHRNRPEMLVRRSQKAHALRALAYEALGGAFCVCCGETAFRLLSLDHINNDGATHRKSDSSTRDQYSWFVKNGMPKGIFQVLCMGCNWGKAANGGVCPHELERKQFIDIAAFSALKAA